jgi:hypothetical protein
MPKIKQIPFTQEELQQAFHYDPDSGILSYRLAETDEIEQIQQVLPDGRPATRYFRISIGNKEIYIHRIIWKLVYGTEAPDHIIHINGNCSDNRQANLTI